MALLQAIHSEISVHLTTLLRTVCADYNLPEEEVMKKYLSSDVSAIPVPSKPVVKVKKARQTVEPAEQCEAMVKGQPCKHKRRPGETKCHLHLRTGTKAPAAPKRPCTGVTGKGQPCNVKAQDGEDLCHLHLAKRRKADEKRGGGMAVASSQPVEQTFCSPCVIQSETQPDPIGEDISAMDMRARVQEIMKAARGDSPPPVRISQSTLEKAGLSDEEAEFNQGVTEGQMDSPHSVDLMKRLTAIENESDDEKEKERWEEMEDEDEEGYLSE